MGETPPLGPMPSGAFEASNFLKAYERHYGDYHPEFQAVSFMEAGEEFKFLFVYLCCAWHVNTPTFCEQSMTTPTGSLNSSVAKF